MKFEKKKKENEKSKKTLFSGRKKSEKKSRDKKKKHPMSMRFFFVLLIIAQILITVAGSSGLLELLHTFIEATREVPDIVLLIGFGLLLGVGTSAVLLRFFSSPIHTLGSAIKKVANGDFSVRLDTESGFAELRQIKRDFNTMAKELGATEILQTDFVSNVSHEFKTPITAIEGYATLLDGSEGATPEQKEYIEKILMNTKRLSSLVGNILLLSKVDNQGIPNKKTRFRLDEQIRSSIVELEPAWSEKNCEFDIEMDEIKYKGNEPLLFHVWKNLIENAIKFGKAGGIITIRLSKTGGKIVFSIQDEGKGIKEEDIKHIFDRFYQSDSSHKSEGNGLGLALVKQILKVEGGEVSAERLSPCGTKFTVTLKN